MGRSGQLSPFKGVGADGTHHYVSREHLHRYLAQFDWMQTNHAATDSARMRMLVGQVDGRRLTYRPSH